MEPVLNPNLPRRMVVRQRKPIHGMHTDGKFVVTVNNIALLTVTVQYQATLSVIVIVQGQNQTHHVLLIVVPHHQVHAVEPTTLQPVDPAVEIFQPQAKSAAVEPLPISAKQVSILMLIRPRVPARHRVWVSMPAKVAIIVLITRFVQIQTKQPHVHP